MRKKKSKKSPHPMLHQRIDRRSGLVYVYAKFNGAIVSFGKVGRVADGDVVVLDQKLHAIARQEYDEFLARWLANRRQLPNEFFAEPDPDKTTLQIADDLARELTERHGRAWLEVPANRRRLDDVLGRVRELFASPDPLTVRGLRDAYVEHLTRANDERWIANNLKLHRYALKPPVDLFGSTPADDFDAERLVQVREVMIASGSLCTNEIKRRVNVVKAMFRWACAEKLVRESLHHGLAAVKHLKPGEFGTKRSQKRRAPPDSVIEATIPYMPEPVQALVRLCRHTGARPSELYGITAADIDRSDPLVWVYDLSTHKTAAWDEDRTLYFDRQAQKILGEWIMRAKSPTAPLFRPCDVVARKNVKETYDRYSFGGAVQRAIDRANCDRHEIPKRLRVLRDLGESATFAEWAAALEITEHAMRTYARCNLAPYIEVDPEDRHRQRNADGTRGIPAHRRRRRLNAAGRAKAREEHKPIPKWTPYDLRRRELTQTTLEHGLEAAQAQAGHRSIKTTERYVQNEVKDRRLRAIMSNRGEAVPDAG